MYIKEIRLLCLNKLPALCHNFTCLHSFGMTPSMISAEAPREREFPLSSHDVMKGDAEELFSITQEDVLFFDDY